MQQYRPPQPEVVHHQTMVQQAFHQPKPFYLPQEQQHLRQPGCPPLPQKQTLSEQHHHQLQNLQLSHCQPVEQHKQEPYSQSQEQQCNNHHQKMQEQQHVQHLYPSQTQEQLQKHLQPREQEHSQKQCFSQQEVQYLLQQHQPNVQQHFGQKHLHQLQKYPTQTLHQQDLHHHQSVEQPMLQQPQPVQHQQLNSQLQEQQSFQKLLHGRAQEQQLQQMCPNQPQENQQMRPQQSQDQQHLPKMPSYQLWEQLHLQQMHPRQSQEQQPLQQIYPRQSQEQQPLQQIYPRQPQEQRLNSQLQEHQSFQKLSSQAQEQQLLQQMRPYQRPEEQQMQPHQSQEQQHFQQLCPPQHQEQRQIHPNQEMQHLLQIHSHKLEEHQRLQQMRSLQQQEHLLQVHQQTSQGKHLQLQVGQTIQQPDQKQECNHPQQQQHYRTLHQQHLQQQQHLQLLQLQHHHMPNQHQQNSAISKDLQSSGYPSARSNTFSINEGVAFPSPSDGECQTSSEQSKSELSNASWKYIDHGSGSLQFPSGNKGVDLSHGAQKMNASVLSGGMPATDAYKPIQPQPERFPFSFNEQGSRPADQMLVVNVNAEHQLSFTDGLRVPFDSGCVVGRQQTYLDRTINQHELGINKDPPLPKPETGKQFGHLIREDILFNNSRTEHSNFILTTNQNVQKDAYLEKCGTALQLSGNSKLVLQIPRTEMQLSRPTQEETLFNKSKTEEILFPVLPPNQCILKNDGVPKELPSWSARIHNSDEGTQQQRHRHDDCLPSELDHSDAVIRSDDNVDYDRSVNIRVVEPAYQIYEDEQWLKKFLSRKRKKTKLKPPLSVVSPSASDARELLYSTLELVSDLSSLCQTLKLNMENETVWADTFSKAAIIKKELLGKIEILRDATYIENVKRKVIKINKKREHIRRKKQEQILEKQERDARAAKRVAKIDAWRMRCVQEAEEADLERELKATADRVLSEVRKKQADTKRVVDILRAIEKLRKLRKEAAARKDVYPSAAADEALNAHILRLRKLIKKRTALYETEERTLKVMLAGEQEEERQREREKKLRKEKERVLQQKKEIESLLFGYPDDLPPLHPLQPFRQYYLQGSDSLPVLVQIRREWDQYLVPEDYPDGSFIPQGWVLPALPSSDSWASTLKLTDGVNTDRI